MRKIALLIGVLLLFSRSEAVGFEKDTLKTTAVNDTVMTIEQIIKKPHSPHRATIIAMILPGSGQIYNKQWWKVPILYAGIAADLYGIVWNNNRFKEYRNAYVDWVQYLSAKAENPDTPYPTNPSWDKIPKAFDVQNDPYLKTSQGQTWFKNTLGNRKTNFKRNRDLCYIVMAAIYAVNIIDATVYAHFYDFEIDDNLSLNVCPTSSYNPLSGGSLGLTLTLNF
ncbi:MAG: DUF5683 domain-containing protein [Odoribacter sp.]